MQLYQPAGHLFAQLMDLLNSLPPAAYSAPSENLSGATIGQHTRHIIELFLELHNGYPAGTVDYEQRRRDYRLESDIAIAAQQLDGLPATLQKPDKPLQLATDLSFDGSGAVSVQTTYHRELLFNIEHTVHHMALIRVAVRELTDIDLPQSFGMAAATLKHREGVCAR